MICRWQRAMLTQAQLGFCTNSTAAYCFYEILPAYYEPEIRLAICYITRVLEFMAIYVTSNYLKEYNVNLNRQAVYRQILI